MSPGKFFNGWRGTSNNSQSRLSHLSTGGGNCSHVRRAIFGNEPALRYGFLHAKSRMPLPLLTSQTLQSSTLHSRSQLPTRLQTMLSIPKNTSATHDSIIFQRHS